ncbi:hypothetical protein [Gordonia malaquae]|uniref:hypothetical protein n=1 Tax=Gordonia malaquae TaxID=410332 RepID=UPI00301943BF
MKIQYLTYGTTNVDTDTGTVKGEGPFAGIDVLINGASAVEVATVVEPNGEVKIILTGGQDDVTVSVVDDR